MSKVEQRVKEFYDDYGWIDQQGQNGEDKLFRSFLRPYANYHAKVNERTKRCLAAFDGALLIPGGGDMPETHVEIARQFEHTSCLDISSRALDIAKQKLGNSGEYINGSVLNIPKPDNTYDAVYFAHVLYHIDKSLQSQAISELLRVTRPGGLILVLYRNPDAVATRLLNLRNNLSAKVRTLIKPTRKAPKRSTGPLYFYSHSLSWWEQFADRADIQLSPWDVMSNGEEKFIFRNNALAGPGYKLAAWLEEKHPKIAVRLWSYVTVSLTKKPA